MRRVIGIVAVSIVIAIGLAAAGAARFLSGNGVRDAIEGQASEWLGQRVRVASARVRVWPRLAVRLSDVRIGDPVRARLNEVDVSASPLALISRRVEEAELRVRNTRVDLPLALPAPGPGPSGPAATNGGPSGGADSSAAFRIVSVNAIALENVTLVSQGRELRLSARSSLVQSRLLVRELTAESGGTSMRATGTILLGPRVDADLRLEANRLDVDELLVLAAAFLPGPGSGPAAASGASPRLKATVTADTARAAGVDARRFTTVMTVDNDRVSLSPLAFEFFGGGYRGDVQARLGAQPTATVRAQVSNIDVAQVAAFGNAGNTATGRLSGSATVSGSGADLEGILAGARGSGSISIADGSLARLGLVRSVVLFFGRPEANAPPSTDRFDRLDARFALQGGVLRADSLELHSADMDTAGTGSLDLNGQALAGQMKVTLSEGLSTQAGTDLRRYTREGSRVVLPVKVGGTLSMPRVSIDAAAALRRGVRNEVEDRAKGLLDRFLRGNQGP